MVLPVLAGESLGTLGRELALYIGSLLLLVSAIIFYGGWGQRQRSMRVDDTPLSDIGDIRSAGDVHIRGKIVPYADHDTFVSPIRGDERCVLSAWEIEEKYAKWEKSAWGIHAVPFYVTDGREKLLVDIADEVVSSETGEVFTPESTFVSRGVSIEGIQCEFEEFNVHVETDTDESPPRRVAEFVENTEGISLKYMAGTLGEAVADESERKYLEQTLQPGDEISLIGHAAPRRDDPRSAMHPEEFVVTQVDRTTLYLSERPFDEVATGGADMLLGALLAIIGVGLLSTLFLF